MISVNRLAKVSSFLIFGMVGVVGFIVDSGVMYTLKIFVSIYFAKVISFFCAVIVTWLLNKYFTFRHRKSGLNKKSEFSRYFSFMIVGGAINYLAFYLSITLSSFIYAFPIFGVMIGSLAGMIFNYMSSSRFIYHKK